MLKIGLHSHDFKSIFEKMKKLIFGAGALLLMSSLISCRDAETSTAEVESHIEEPVLKEETKIIETTVEADSLEVKTEAQIDSVPVSETEIK